MFRGVQGPHVDGSWVGTLVPVTVFDYDGKAYKVAALRIEQGPDWPADNAWYGRIRPELGGGTEPLLAKERGADSVALPADALPLGKRVRVRGTMYTLMIAIAIPDADRPYNYGARFVKVSREAAPPNWWEHLILLKGGPKVIGD